MLNLKNFDDKKLLCQETGKENPNRQWPMFMENVQILRSALGFAFNVTSAYRALEHSIEVAKESPGSHTRCALDFRVTTEEAYEVIAGAIRMGVFKGIGVKKSSVKGCVIIHLDSDPLRKVKRFWGY